MRRFAVLNYAAIGNNTQKFNQSLVPGNRHQK